MGCLSLEISGKKNQMNATLTPVGYPILNGGTGRFPMIGLDVFQYSMPTLETRGDVSVNGKTYEINGNTWFDRQWQNINTADMTWGWMDLNLSNGVYGSLWFPVENGKERPFVTLLYPDGTQNVVPVSPVIANARDIWKSTDVWKKNDYPTKWEIEIPECNATLQVVTEIKEQELQFKWAKPLNHYEAVSTISGTFQGKAVSGKCYVELLAMKP